MILIWQNPVSRKFVKVSLLDEQTDGTFAFRYLPGAGDIDGFAPLAQFPDVNGEYKSEHLPAFFANRVMSAQRPSYQEFLSWLGIRDGDDLPVEILLRTGGPRATDTFHIVEDLHSNADGVVISRFLASGVRHIAGATDRLTRLDTGCELRLRDEPRNQVNPRAVLIDSTDGEPVGYVPDWLLDDLAYLRSEARDLRIFAERINPAAPAHLRLLCRIEATVEP
jgi:hypothetical protein